MTKPKKKNIKSTFLLTFIKSSLFLLEMFQKFSRFKISVFDIFSLKNSQNSLNKFCQKLVASTVRKVTENLYFDIFKLFF